MFYFTSGGGAFSSSPTLLGSQSSFCVRVDGVKGCQNTTQDKLIDPKSFWFWERSESPPPSCSQNNQKTHYQYLPSTDLFSVKGRGDLLGEFIWSTCVIPGVHLERHCLHCLMDVLQPLCILIHTEESILPASFFADSG